MYEPRTPVISYGPFEKWGIDAIGPLARISSGKEYIIVAADYMTRWAEAASTKMTTAQDIGKFIYDFICCGFGIPLEIVSHHGPESEEEVIQKRLIDLQHLSMKRELAVEHYINQAKKRREEFNKQLKDKGLTEGTLVLRYDNRFDKRHDTKFQPRWEGPFLIKTKFKNGSYQLMDMLGKLHKTKVNGWRLQKYWQRIEESNEQ
ncbi:hypothetical protein KP509_19G074800 [Ceratopteris richardii]|uniref:Integrase catalytic domain-containing protein n=1 Tax=Ceratopteris richardii TaxID=49495 RepID=A0A8T2SLR4_CERRI|nr:hypothetical protein KP509_19G074800 [Ceratopteris richardii]